VTVFEAADYVGGLASGFKHDRWDWSVERYYHHWFASDRHILKLIDELGWAEDVIFPRPITAVYHDGRFFALDSALAVMRFSGLPVVDRIRMGVVIAFLKYLARWQPLEKVTAHEWLQKWVGQQAYQILWEPLLVGKFGEHFRDVNMAWFWARVKARTPRLGTFRGGFQAFMNRFAEQIHHLGGTIQLNTAVDGIASAKSGVLLTIGGAEERFDQCLVTTSPHLLAKLCPGLPEAYLEQILNLRSMGAIVMVLALKHRLSEEGFYWHNLPKSAGFPFLSMVEHTNYVSREHFGGDTIVYLGDYLDPEHEYFRMSDSELLELFLPILERFNSQYRHDWVLNSWIFRTPYAQPIPPLGHSHNIPDIRTPVKGLWFASMSQVYPWDRGTNFAVEIARLTVKSMLQGTDQ
jgi:protoporphyrinogen oxidase